jgi:hypothetical protein
MESLLNMFGVHRSAAPNTFVKETIEIDRTIDRSLTSDIVTSEVVVEKAPIVHETIRHERLEEIQPIIHREIEQPEIHRVTQPLFEKVLRDTFVSEKNLESEYRADFVEKPR